MGVALDNGKIIIGNPTNEFTQHDLSQAVGFVRLVDMMPNPGGGDAFITADGAIVQAARVSYGVGTKKVNEDRGLIRYLLRHQHTTPFEMVQFKFHIRMPIFIYRQWFRHRSSEQGEIEISSTDEAARKFISMNEYCLAPGTKILKPDLTWTKIEDLKVGDEVVGFTETPLNLKKNKFRTVKVTGTTRQDLPCYRVTTPDGSVVCSAQHRWAVASSSSTVYRWVETQDLRPEMKIAFSVKPWETPTDFDSGWLAGILDGEGWVSGALLANKPQANGGVSFHLGVAQNEGLVLDRIKDLFTRRQLTWHAHRQNAKRGGNCWTVAVSRRYDVLRLLGELRPQRLLNKVLPVWMNSGKIAGTASEIQAVTPVGVAATIGLATESRTFIADGFLSHNSARYSVVPDIYYVPRALRGQSATNKQGGEELLSDDINAACRAVLNVGAKDARVAYEAMLKEGVSRELARLALPVSYVTEFYMSINLWNLLHMLKLRCDSHAQLEIRYFANALAWYVKQYCPITYQAWLDYMVNGVAFSAQELVQLQGFPGPDSLVGRELTEYNEKLSKKPIDPAALSETQGLL